MAARYYRVGHSMGYAGTKSEETIDLCDLWGWTASEVEDADQDEVLADLHKDEWEQACEKIDTWAEPVDED